MRIAVTGATGFIGRYIVRQLVSEGHQCCCWHRPGSDRGGFDAAEQQLHWVAGSLRDESSMQALLSGCDAVVHAALDRPGTGFRHAEGHLPEFLETNLLGTIRLIETARQAAVPRFIFISTCAVHERILDDRPLDETHPLWPTTHYGAHKAAVEKFVHSYGWGQGYEICALRPCGVYGVAHPPPHSKWFPLVCSIVRGEPVTCTGGGKEVHAADVARAVSVLLRAQGTAGQAYNCCDKYVSQLEVAELAREFSGGRGPIQGGPTQPKHLIETGKLTALGLQFGGTARLRQTIADLVQWAREHAA